MKQKNLGLKLTALIVLIILLLVIILQNLSPATIQLLFWKFENLPVIAIILVTLVLGYTLGLLTFSLIFRTRPPAGTDETFLQDSSTEDTKKKKRNN